MFKFLLNRLSSQLSKLVKKPENVILASEARPESASCNTKCMFSSGCAPWKGFRASRNDV